MYLAPVFNRIAPASCGRESKNAVPSKKPNRCCGADTDMRERASAYSEVLENRSRCIPRAITYISERQLNVYLNAKKAARPVPRLPVGRPSQVQVCTTSPVRALVFSDRSQRSCFDEIQDR